MIIVAIMLLALIAMMAFLLWYQRNALSHAEHLRKACADALKEARLAHKAEVNLLNQTHADEIERLEQENQRQVGHLNQLVEDLGRGVETLERDNSKLTADNNRIRKLTEEWTARGDQHFDERNLKAWLTGLRNARYQTRMEVNTQFIFPLLRHLDFDEPALRQNVDVQIPTGSRPLEGIVDWLVHKRGDQSGGSPLFLVHTLHPGAPLDQDVLDWTYLLACSLKVDQYVITNGEQLRIYACKANSSQPSVVTAVANLGDQWLKIKDDLNG